MTNIATCTCPRVAVVGRDPRAVEVVQNHLAGCPADGAERERLSIAAGVTRRNVNEDRKETYNRAGVVRTILERCHAELLALQCIPHLTADDVNELGAAKGFVERAMLAIGRLPL